MECKKCSYYRTDTVNHFGKPYTRSTCIITNRVNPISCFIASDAEIASMMICYNCKHWIGGGDWGLSCRKNYYLSSTNGFRETCEEFERKNENETSL